MKAAITNKDQAQKEVPPKKKRGRPPGAKNKKKLAEEEAAQLKKRQSKMEEKSAEQIDRTTGYGSNSMAGHLSGDFAVNRQFSFFHENDGQHLYTPSGTLGPGFSEVNPAKMVQMRLMLDQNYMDQWQEGKRMRKKPD